MSTTSFAAQQQFQEDRLHFIGGSDIHHLFNLEPYGCELALFKKKTGVKPDIPFYGNRATMRGTLFEEAAARFYADLTGRQVRNIGPRQYSKFPVLRPQADREIINDPRGAGILSIKVPGTEAFRKIKRAVLASIHGAEPKSEFEQKMFEEGKRILFPYMLQLQAELAAYNRPWGSYGFMLAAEGLDMVHVDWQRDDNVIESIEVAARRFWDNKERGVAPPKLDPKSPQCKNCEFRLTCQQEHLLKMLESGEDSDSVLAKLITIDPLVQELREREMLSKEAEAMVDEQKNIIRLALADVDAAEGLQYRVYNRLQAGRTTVQGEPLIKFLRDHAENAKNLLKAVEKGQIVLPPEAVMLIDVMKQLPIEVRNLFFKTGLPFRQLRHYELTKKKENGNGHANPAV